MKTALRLFSFLLLVTLLVQGCSNSSTNPVIAPATPKVLTGMWQLIYGDSTDSLLVTLDIKGSDGKLGGYGQVEYFEIVNKAKKITLFAKPITGTYSATSIVGAVGWFSFTGTKSDSNYAGTATYIKSYPLTTDILKVTNIIYVKIK